MPKKARASRKRGRSGQRLASELRRRLWRSRGGHARAALLSPETRSEIARMGHRAMLETRCIRLLEQALFDLFEVDAQGESLRR